MNNVKKERESEKEKDVKGREREIGEEAGIGHGEAHVDSENIRRVMKGYYKDILSMLSVFLVHFCRMYKIR